MIFVCAALINLYTLQSTDESWQVYRTGESSIFCSRGCRRESVAEGPDWKTCVAALHVNMRMRWFPKVHMLILFDNHHTRVLNTSTATAQPQEPDPSSLKLSTIRPSTLAKDHIGSVFLKSYYATRIFWKSTHLYDIRYALLTHTS